MSGTVSENPDLNFILYGTTRTDPKPSHLRAGRLTADFAGGNLRTIAYDSVEVLRAVAFLVRDRDWGTYDPSLRDLTIAQHDDGFFVSYGASYSGPDGTRLDVLARISASDSGRLIFEAEAYTETGFETNRCGFCILHPIIGLAGMPVTVEHVDGTVEQTKLPDLIEPWQPFKDMRAIVHTAMPDVTAECRMEGDTFEMEDQRNWSDASYKTYVRPLALPWPYRIPAGQSSRQRIVLTINDRRGTKSESAKTVVEPVHLSFGNEQGIMPGIGMIITPEEARATFSASAILQEVGAQELLFHFDPLAGHGAPAFSDFAAILKYHQGTSTLEIAVPCKRSPAEEMREIAEMMHRAGFQPDAVFVSPSVDRQSTPPGSVWPECPPLDEIYLAARPAFPSCRLGGGMLSYFTELNRKRVPPDNLDFVSHCTNPIVHAADDLSVMQTLEALPFITRSTRAIYGDMPYRIGPSTIAMRQNPYGSRTMENPGGNRIPMANRDPRHNGLFAASYTLGYAAATLPAGLERLTLSALTGPFGLISGREEPVAEGGRRPLFHVVRGLAALAGAKWIECLSSDPSRIVALAAETSEADRTLWLANITADTVPVELQALAIQARTAVIMDAASIKNRNGGTEVRLDTAAPLLLPPFAVAAIKSR